ncbi:ATP-binding protein [Rhizobacter sp. Root1221]|uniref:ATP-binding protein n=1 Tax=Rhizobacter sp. Root1221 TaxID=1736433 RepID=UPI001F18BFCF|nr:ATP-binding protein [Rhizobacter sp. Root1221]
MPFYEWLDVPIWVFDAERLQATWANRAGLTFWQADSVAELQARDFSDVSEGVRTRLDLSTQAHARGEVTRDSWTLYPNGTPFTSVLVSRGILLPDGRQGILFASEPVSAQLDGDALRGAEAIAHTTVRVALHSLPDGLALMRNPAAVQAFGPIPPGDAPRPSDFDGLFPDPAVAARIMAQVRKGQTFSAELELATLGGLRWHGVDVRPVVDPVTGRRAMQVNARDIADLKATQKALEGARVAADNANMAKSAFLANMSHEIRTPMNGVLGLTELVLHTELNAKQRQYITLANQSAKGLMVIIDDLLDVAKIEAGQMVIEHRPFAVRKCLEEALAPLLLTAQQKGLRLAWQVADSIPATLVGDAVRLRQVLINLAGNAVKFTNQGSVQVTVEPVLDAPPGGVPLRFTVRDTGIGMSPEHLDRVFEPFVQADSSITRRYGGTGLGLAIVARLVKLMGGEIAVASTEGVGSCLSFTALLALPGGGGTDPEPPSSMSSSAPLPLHGLTFFR